MNLAKASRHNQGYEPDQLPGQAMTIYRLSKPNLPASMFLSVFYRLPEILSIL
jgi:TATA-box binding protein (TBP) (component of TFIID and TFIIIB)